MASPAISATNSTLDELLTAICHQLQITDTQQGQAERHYNSIGKSLQAPGSPLLAHRPVLYPQGSLKLGTTVRPEGGEPFDLDIVCELATDPRRFPHPPALITGIAAYLNRLPAYVGKIRTKNRCVRVVYVDQFHLDILPACGDPLNCGTHLVVPDRDSQTWKASNPKGYAKWFESRCAFVPKLRETRGEPIPPKEPVQVKPTLKLATQLLKRWRNGRYAHNKSVAPISIVLTTLAGMHYQGQDSVSVALLEIVDEIARRIPTYGSRLVVLNPVNSAEDLSEKWDKNPQAYRAFVSGINDLLQDLRELSAPQSILSSSKKLSNLFGHDVSTSAIRQLGETYDQNRAAGNLYVRPHSGALSRIATVGAAIPIRSHSFYGA